MAINREIYDIEKISHGQYDIWKIYERYEATTYLVAKVFILLEKEIATFCKS